MGILADTGYEAKQTDNKAGKRLAKTGLLLIALVEILLFIEDMRDERKSVSEKL